MRTKRRLFVSIHVDILFKGRKKCHFSTVEDDNLKGNSIKCNVSLTKTECDLKSSAGSLSLQQKQKI